MVEVALSSDLRVKILVLSPPLSPLPCVRYLSLEAVDENIGRIIEACDETDSILIVTADHGNSDNMLDKEGRVLTAHSMSKVPFIVTLDNIKLKDGKLADIAPTILKIMEIDNSSR